MSPRGTRMALVVLVLICIAMVGSSAFAAKVVVVTNVTARPDIAKATPVLIGEALPPGTEVQLVQAADPLDAKGLLGIAGDADRVLGVKITVRPTKQILQIRGLQNKAKVDFDAVVVDVATQAVVWEYHSDRDHPWAVQASDNYRGDPALMAALMVLGGGMAADHFFPNWGAANAVGYTTGGGAYWAFTNTTDLRIMAGNVLGALVLGRVILPNAGRAVQYGVGIPLLALQYLIPAGKRDELEAAAVGKGITNVIAANSATIVGPQLVS